jgi:REP element-mobilizing transposase RayT
MSFAGDFFETGKFYHIYSKAVGNELLFTNDDNFKFFLKKYDEYCFEMFETLAYCLIPNHFHFLVRIKEGRSNEEVVKKFSDFLNSYSKAFNKANERNGALFQRKFKRKIISSEAYLTRIILYIHLNPFKHKLVEDFRKWKYSSFNSYSKELPTKINKKVGLEWFGGLQAFLKIHNEIKEDYLLDDFLLE